MHSPQPMSNMSHSTGDLKARRHRSRRAVPADLPLIHQAERRVLRHRDLQHLRAEPSRGRPRQHPRPRLEIQGRRLHPSRRRPRQHRDQHQRPRSANLLGGRQPRSPTDDTDFYDGSWDDEANDRNELGNDAHDTSQTGNFPFTGCSNTTAPKAKFYGVSFNALGENYRARWGQLNSTATDSGPIRRLRIGNK